jgi:hypothetical protein
MTETAQVQRRTFEVGGDRVTISDQETVIEVRHPLPDWDVREINHVPVYVEDRKYYLVEKRKAELPYAIRYLLKPWPEYQGTNATNFLSFDTEVLRDRDARLREDRLQELGRAFLLPFYPLLGMLWSGTQNRLTRFGFLPHAMSGFSIFTIFSLVFGQAVFAVIMLNTSLRTGKVMIGGFLRAIAPGDYMQLGPVAIPITVLDISLLVMLLVDVIVRYSQYLRDDQWCGGFLEWLVRRPRRREPQVTPIAPTGR